MRKLDIMRTAARIGREHAQAELIWFAMPATVAIAQKWLDGMDNNDPVITDNLPGPDLSGEFVEVYSDADLMEDLGLDGSTPHQQVRFRRYYAEACESYEKAFRDTVTLAVWEACRKVIDQ